MIFFKRICKYKDSNYNPEAFVKELRNQLYSLSLSFEKYPLFE